MGYRAGQARGLEQGGRGDRAAHTSEFGMDDPHPSSDTSPPSSPSREGITLAVSLISAGAGLNSWFPAFKLLGAGLVVAGFAVLAGALWPAARQRVPHRLRARPHHLVAGGGAVALLGAGAFVALQPSMHPPSATLLGAPEPVIIAAPTPSLFDILPSDDDIPVALVETVAGKRTGEALARLRSSNADELMQRLEEWGFVENAYREFGRPVGATPTPQTMYLLEVSLHRFSLPAGAAGALAWYAADRAELAGLAPQTVARIGDESQAIAGDQKGETGATVYREATVYTRVAAVMVRVTVRSQGANPMPTAVDVARSVAVQLAAA
jgi:hypothetical protein